MKFPGGMQQLLKQANQMQARMQKTKEELKTRQYEATSGGGAVSVKVNGSHQLCELKIKPEVLEEKDSELLEDMILTAVNESLKQVTETNEKEMEKISGGMGLF